MNRQQEINIVKALGDEIGYGNLMEIASVLWHKMLKDAGGPTSGAFVATCPDFIKKGYFNEKQYTSTYNQIISELENNSANNFYLTDNKVVMGDTPYIPIRLNNDKIERIAISSVNKEILRLIKGTSMNQDVYTKSKIEAKENVLSNLKNTLSITNSQIDMVPEWIRPQTIANAEDLKLIIAEVEKL